VSEWIRCSEEQPPKNRAFIFQYFGGIGVGHWGQCFTTIIGNSERTHEAYILYNTCESYDGNGLKEYTWQEDYMIEMEVNWMPLPIPPDK